MRTHPLVLSSCALALSTLAACGGGGGSGGSATAGDEIGRRSVPGYEVVVSRVAGDGAGTYRVALAGSAAPRAVAAWLACCGYDPDAATVAAEPLPDAAATWRVTLPAAPGQLWVRITDADGNILEAGGEVFAIVP